MIPNKIMEKVSPLAMATLIRSPKRKTFLSIFLHCVFFVARHESTIVFYNMVQIRRNENKCIEIYVKHLQSNIFKQL